MIITNGHNLHTITSNKGNLLPKRQEDLSSSFSLLGTVEDTMWNNNPPKTDTYTSQVGESTNHTFTSDTYTNLAYNRVIEISQLSPYALMANNTGIIDYHGVTYTYNKDDKLLGLGDISNPDDVIKVPLTTGETLYINRNNIDELAKSISMFTPADQKRIMDAIYTDAKCRNKKGEMEELKNKVMNDIVDNTHNSKETDSLAYNGKNKK